MFEIGEALRTARERRHLTYAEVEAVTLIPTRYLQALEREEFDRIPPGLYCRSFLREYADFVGLQADVLVDEYQLRLEPDPEPEAEPAPAFPRSRVLSGDRLRRLAPAAVVLALAAAALAVGLTGTGSRKLPPAARSSAPARHPVAAVHARPAHAAAPPVAAPAVLQLTAATGPCWLRVDVESATPHRAFEGTLEQGQTIRFGLRAPLRIRLGAPWNLRVSVEGRAVTSGLPTSTGNVIVSRSGVRPA